MDALAVRQVLGQRLIQPFVLHLADERALEILHPDFISVLKTGRLRRSLL
ncbi:MAG: hypothetical protein NTW03_08825 [Verrucomicrobia bacterium]|nr:hypothetical protein [Verrucomicrobiota bacterium]